MLEHFKPFEKNVATALGRRLLFRRLERDAGSSDDVGIRAWQQQVPMRKSISGQRLEDPLHPVPAKEPQTAKGKFLRGADRLPSMACRFSIRSITVATMLTWWGIRRYGGHWAALTIITITSRRYTLKK